MYRYRYFHRVVILIFTVLLLTGGAVRTLFYLQAENGQSYSAQAIAQITKTQAIPAKRGLICDRNGEILVNTVSKIDVEGHTQHTRAYPISCAAHLLGRTGAIYAEEWEKYQKLGYSMQETVGKDGLERELEPYLRGISGFLSETAGQPLEVLASPKQGNTCMLTLDATLQQASETALADHLSAIEQAHGGAVVVMEVNTGRILAMASYPTYELATFSQDYTELSQNLDSPLFNRALQGLYPPGSTFKMVTGVAALESGQLQPTETYTCVHDYTRYTDHTFTCMGTHGALEVTGAIAKSCNAFFYEMGYRVGGRALEDWAHKFGLGEKTGIAIGGEAVGQVAGPQNRVEMQAQKPYYEDWQGGDVLQAAIGQSDTVCTPLQMARYLAALVNGGRLFTPYLVERVCDAESGLVVAQFTPDLVRTINVSAQTLDLVKQGMGAVMQEGGTAGGVFADYPIEVGGKSGTAQTENRADNAMFLAFAPFESPEIAVCVVGEGAGGGSKMAPVVRDIFDAYFNLR